MVMRRRVTIAALVLFGLGLAAVLLVATRGPGTVARSRRVHLGMSIAEVRSIMGSGTFEGKEFSDGKVTGTFLLAGHDEGIVNKLGQLGQDLGADDLLVDSSTSVLIMFDTEGRVAEITRGEEPPIKATDR